ncbi:hypothetical protein D3C80_2033710 [compost metagenome]
MLKKWTIYPHIKPHIQAHMAKPVTARVLMGMPHIRPHNCPHIMNKKVITRILKDLRQNILANLQTHA